MGEQDFPPGPLPPDNLSRFPVLQRAREAYIDLFTSDKPLREMNYNASQMQLVKPILRLVEGPGTIRKVGGG